MVDEVCVWSRAASAGITSTVPSPSSPTDSVIEEIAKQEPLHLPDEIIIDVLSYLPSGEQHQGALWTCCLLSRQWHNLAVSQLYAEPHLYGRNFDPFVKTICPSLNAHIRKSDLAFLVRTLDMSKLAYQGSRSITARLLGRTKTNLLRFVAPQANWGVNCLAALSRCTKLRDLDLSLISEALGYRELSMVIKKMTDLRSFKFPRSAPKHADYDEFSHMSWPQKLSDLTLSGDLSEFIDNDVDPRGIPPNLPQGVTRLTFEHSNLDSRDFRVAMEKLGPPLNYLKLCNLTCSDFDWPYPEGASKILHLCPNLETLVMGADLLTSTLLFSDETDDVLPITMNHPLRTLYIATPARSGSFIEEELLTTREITRALEDGALPDLRNVTLEVFFNAPKEWKESDLLLHRKLKARAAERAENPHGRGVLFAVLQAS